MLDPNLFLPRQLIALRPMRPDDLPLLVRWIEEGRREGAFRAATPLTVNSLLAYQRELGDKGLQYQCLIAEHDGRPAGYLDFHHCFSTGEVLGFYLEPVSRSKNFGQHMLRWVTAKLREIGCRDVSVEVYSDNPASLRTCQNAGFFHDLSANRDEDGRALFRLNRSLNAFKRFSSPSPLYSSLSGEDIHLHHVAIAEALTARIGKIPGVEVILGLGSIGRGFADQWSDIDLTVLGRGPGLEEIWRGEAWASGMSLDLSVVDLDTLPPVSWDDARRQAFQEAVVLYEKDSALTDSLDDILRLGREEKTAKIGTLLLRLGWIGFQPRAWSGRCMYGYKWSVPYDLWLRRGCMASAQATVDQALDLAIQLIYLANFRHVPDQKWRRYLLSGLPWLPEKLAGSIFEVEQRAPGEASFRSRAEALLILIDEIAAHLEASGELSGDIYRQYLLSEPNY